MIKKPLNALKRLVERVPFACGYANPSKFPEKLLQMILARLAIKQKWLRNAIPFVSHSYRFRRSQLAPDSFLNRPYVARELEALPCSVVARARASIAHCQSFEFFLQSLSVGHRRHRIPRRARRFRRPKRLRIFMRFRTFMRLRRTRGRETGHVQIKVHRLSNRKAFPSHEESEFIALTAFGKTFVMPKAI